jgi:hypothetical protein
MPLNVNAVVTVNSVKQNGHGFHIHLFGDDERGFHIRQSGDANKVNVMVTVRIGTDEKVELGDEYVVTVARRVPDLSRELEARHQERPDWSRELGARNRG